MKRLDEKGREIPDPTPVTIPAGFKRPETLAEQVQRLVRTHISREAAERGFETFDEANDFDVDDDPVDPSTPYETFFDPVLGKELTPLEFQQHEQVYRQRYLEAQRAYFEQHDRMQVLQRRYSLSEKPDPAIPEPAGEPSGPPGRKARRTRTNPPPEPSDEE